MTYYSNDIADTVGIHTARLGSDQSADGYIISDIVGESVDFGDLLYLSSIGKYYKSKSDTIDTMPTVAVSLQKIAANKMCPMMFQGMIRDDNLNLNIHELLYTSNVAAGKITTFSLLSSYNTPIGFTTRPNQYFFNPQYYSNSISNSLADVQKDINNLYNFQSINISYPVWSSGRYTILESRKHVRLKIVEAWAQIGDNTGRDQTLEIIGISKPLTFSSGYGAGSIKPFEIGITRSKIPFWRPIEVLALTDRRATVNLILNSYEGDV